MLAAAITVWLMFALWLGGPYLGMSRGLTSTAACLLAMELTTLLVWSYGCEFGGCTPLASAAGVAARTDVPVLAAVFVALVAGRALRGRMALSRT